jgi:hypothetical protein
MERNIDDPLLAPQTFPEEEPEHECVFSDQDCDICKGCGDHAQFCEECGSECCGAAPYAMD